jgi:hypothetical protein
MILARSHEGTVLKAKHQYVCRSESGRTLLLELDNIICDWAVMNWIFSPQGIKGCISSYWERSVDTMPWLHTPPAPQMIQDAKQVLVWCCSRFFQPIDWLSICPHSVHQSDDIKYGWITWTNPCQCPNQPPESGPGNSTVLVPFVFFLCSPPLHDLVRSSRGIRVWLVKREWSRLEQASSY